MQVTFELPDEVVTQLQPFEDKLPQILGLGLREFKAIAQEGFSGMAEVLEFLASLVGWVDVRKPNKKLLGFACSRELRHFFQVLFRSTQPTGYLLLPFAYFPLLVLHNIS